MLTLDWIVLTLYLGAMIALSAWLSRGQRSESDYFVGSRNLPWWAVGISIVATQSSAISFVSIPAFVALREGGGLTWLQYELAVPLAMLFLLGWVIPYLRDLKLVSIFEFPRERFGPATGRTLAAVFLISRGLATGIGVYATALVVSTMLGWSLEASILLIGVVAIIYDTLGGLKAVVASDVLQMGLIFVGVIAAIGFALVLVGGPGAAWEAMAPERKAAVDWSSGIGDEATAPFWAYLIGGFFLYASYYGTDQSQVQRLLGTAHSRDAQRAVLLGGMLRLPLTLLYIGLGIAIGAVWQISPDLQAAVPMERVDALVPQYLLMFVPVGLKGLLLAAILAAAMSSLDSALNSLSAVTMKDFVGPLLGGDPEDRHLGWSKVTTVGWGIAITALALVADQIDRTVIEAINKIGSAFYGPVLATFAIGLFSKVVRGRAMLVGLLAGVGINVTAWLMAWPIHWMWWNVMGCAVTVVVAQGLSMGRPQSAVTLPVARWRAAEVRWATPLLLGGFALTLCLVIALR